MLLSTYGLRCLGKCSLLVNLLRYPLTKTSSYGLRCLGKCSAEPGRQLLHHACLCRLGRRADAAGDGPRVRAPVANEDGAAHADERRAAVLGIVEPLERSAEPRAQ